MITKYELGLIAEKLSEENFFESDEASAGEITSVVYRCDALDCGGASACVRYIDVEFSSGEFYEIRASSPLFRFVCGLSGCPPLGGEWEALLFRA